MHHALARCTTMHYHAAMSWGLDEFADWLFPPDESEVTATTLDLLATGYPAFRFRRERVGLRGQRWITERKNGLDPGLHTLITASLGGLLRALHRDRHAMETTHAMHGKPDGSLAKLFRDFGERWEIENVQPGT